MANVIFLLSYFSNPLPQGVLVASLSVLFLLFVSAKRVAERPRIRTAALLSILGTYVFLWIFLASSIAICFSVSDYYVVHPEYAIKSVVSWALSIALVSALPSSVLIKRLALRAILKSIKGSPRTDRMTENTLLSLANTMNVSNMRLLQLPTSSPVSFAISGETNAVVVSEGLRSLLDVHELEAVFAHELSHLKYRDSTVKAVTSVLRRVMLFDPLLRLLDAAISREVEFRADEEAALVTSMPGSLASALIKIHRNSYSSSSEPLLSLCLMGPGQGVFNRHPSLADRVERLLRLAERLESKGK